MLCVLCLGEGLCARDSCFWEGAHMRVLCVDDSSARAQMMKEKHVERMLAKEYGREYRGWQL